MRRLLLVFLFKTSIILSRSAVALMSKLYTMGPTIVTGVGRGVTKFVGNYIGDWF